MVEGNEGVPDRSGSNGRDGASMHDPSRLHVPGAAPSGTPLLAFTRMTCDLIENIRLLEVPVIASLNGTTCGAGAVIAAAADIRLASEHAKIAFLFTQVGLSGADMGAAWLLPRIVGIVLLSLDLGL